MNNVQEQTGVGEEQEKKGFHLGKRRSAHHIGSRWTAIYFFGSLKLAMFLFLFLILAMAWGTIEESRFDARMAQHKIYNSGWFTFWLIVLCLNLACATFTRLPWRKKHTGFVITHLGIILLLIGSIIGQRFGIEGSMTLNVGDEPKDRLFLNQMILQFWEPTTREVYRADFPLDLSPPSESRPRYYAVPGQDGPGLGGTVRRMLNRPPEHPTMVFDRYAAHVAMTERLVPAEGMGVPAVELRLHSSMMDEETPVNLISEPADRSYHQLAGLAQISLGDEIVRTFEAMEEPSPLMQVRIDDAGQIAYHTINSRGEVSEGTAMEGERFQTGWADWEVEVVQVLPEAEWDREVRETDQRDPERAGIGAARGWLDWGDGRRTEPEWYLAGEIHTLNIDEHLVYFGFGFREERLPFTVQLIDFDVPRDPGTENPADYASTLRFEDPETGEVGQGTCSMNVPATFPEGFSRLLTGFTYKFSQASWNPEDLSESTVQVLRDPGWLLKWIGSLIIVVGIYIIFFHRGYRSRRPEDFIDEEIYRGSYGNPKANKTEATGKKASEEKEADEEVVVAK